MALETLSSNELLNYIIYDTISATPFSTTTETTFFHLQNQNPNPNSSLTTAAAAVKMSVAAAQPYCGGERPEKKINEKLGVEGGVGRKKKRRRARVCKNKEEAESQRMTHIAVERNRRKQMNHHLAVLKSLMPESYVQRGDQASIVGGAIEFVKELEYLLQSLEAQKFLIHHHHQQQEGGISHDHNSNFATNLKMLSSNPPFSQFFSYPQYTCSQIPSKYTSKSKGVNADIQVTLIETHANLRILLRKRLNQLSKIVASFQSLLHLSILHLNLTTLDPLVLYSISVKVEEGCQLNSADEIATAVQKMLIIIEEEDALCVGSIN